MPQPGHDRVRGGADDDTTVENRLDGSGRVGDFFIVLSPGSVAFLGCTQCDRVQPLRSPYTCLWRIMYKT